MPQCLLIYKQEKYSFKLVYGVSISQATVQKTNSKPFKETEIEIFLEKKCVLSETDCLNRVTGGLGQKKNLLILHMKYN